MNEAERAVKSLADWCARQERCEFDARQKLDSYDISQAEKERIIELLVADKYIDNGRYALFYARDKFRFNGWGKIKIQWQLSQKKVDSPIIEDVLSQIDDHEYQEKLTNLLSQKLKTLKGKDIYQVKASLLRFSQSRGFEYGLANKIIGQIVDKK